MNLKLALPIALISTLCLTFAFRFLIARLTEPATAVTPVVPAPPPLQPLPMTAATIASPSEPEAPPPQPVAVTPNVRPAVAQPEPATDPDDPSQMDVPVTVQARRDLRKSGIEAFVVSLSPEPMTVELTATNAAGRQTSSLQVSVRPHERKNLAASGLTLESADTVTVHSAPYRDRHIRVP